MNKPPTEGQHILMPNHITRTSQLQHLSGVAETGAHDNRLMTAAKTVKKTVNHTDMAASELSPMLLVIIENSLHGEHTWVLMCRIAVTACFVLVPIQDATCKTQAHKHTFDMSE